MTFYHKIVFYFPCTLITFFIILLSSCQGDMLFYDSSYTTYVIESNWLGTPTCYERTLYYNKNHEQISDIKRSVDMFYCHR